jgi:RNA polymerase sigma factor (sigma-70 family)
VQQRSPARADRPRPAPEQPQRRSPESSATLADLYARHHEWLVRVISGRLNYTDRSWAEDLAQEVWLKVWPTLDRLDDLDSPRGFLTSVARHVVTDHYSPSRPAVVARRMEHLVEHWEFLDRPSALPSSSLPSSSLPSPSLPSPSLAPPRAAQVAIALGGLPGVTRRAVELHVGLGWSLRETADEMGLRLAAVHYRATTGMRALQESLSGAETGVQAGAA